MKYILPAIVTAISIFVSCEESNTQDDGVICVDVSKTKFTKKELILQDFMDVEYLILETNNEFLNQGVVEDIGDNFILVRNRNQDGTIFVYNRDGTALRKINRRGQGPEEYTNSIGLILDEKKGEIFVNDHFTRRIQVYDLYGTFIRTLRQQEGEGLFYTDIFNYDANVLLGYARHRETGGFDLISKIDGSVIRKINTPFKEKKYLLQTSTIGENTYMVGPPNPYRTINPHKGNWILLEISSDIVYMLKPDNRLEPIISRTPSVQTMDPEVMLLVRLMSDRYIFMETLKNEYNFETRRGFPITSFLMYDRQESGFFGYNVYNSDYSTKKEIYMNWLRPVNHEIESWQPLEAHELVEDYENGILQGRLKEIASTLDPEDNPVIMLIKHKQ